MNHLATAVLSACLLTGQAWSAPPHDAGPAQPVSLEQWSARVTRSIDSRLSGHAAIWRQTHESGIVIVEFSCSQSGKPEQVVLAKSSGSRELDRAALSAVKRIGTLHPLPDGITPSQKYQGSIVFADTVEETRRLRTQVDNQQARLGRAMQTSRLAFAPIAGIATP